jgi:hypothetical protein
MVLPSILIDPPNLSPALVSLPISFARSIHVVVARSKM